MPREAAVTTKGIGRSIDTDGRGRSVPGEPGIWIFILLDMLVFAEMFVIFAWNRGENRELFDISQQALNPAFGLVYTLLLVASSWCVVSAVGTARRRLVDVSSRLVLWAFVLGAAFAAIKIVEYVGKLNAGITPITNDFFMLFFVMTFVHLLHASVGLGVLIYMRNQIRALEQPSDPSDGHRMQLIEAGGVYWHMVDLLWIVLFALFYLRG
jgi:nitric oxide reductase NorE protein